ncbi:hypothetical protein [Spirochaeta isovalerica]|uniref:Alginate export domain-containing protein n=1 Tax=Spirochaeta isovalerica TaxID=150 RepID=A0A841R970_9SPIO|nr:hypothetical protein [Spirochaeta isovalerica]MBB6479737.1 hypothetical protein [Spirochaeta isovalerica]
MKKLLIIATAFSLFTGSLSAVDFDWGGVLQNSTDGSSINDLHVTEVVSLSLWGELQVSPMLNFKASGGYRFKYDGSADEPVDHIPEFGALYGYGSNSLINWKAGRFSISDMNKNLFSTLWDGAQFGLRTDKFRIESGIGFTRLIFNDNSNIQMTALDVELAGSGNFLASPRMAEYVEAAFYILPGDGALTAAFLAQQDFRGIFSPDILTTGDGLLHSFYLNVGLKGRIGSMLFYNLYGTGEAGIYNMAEDDASLTLLAGAAGLKLTLPLNVFLKPLITTDLFYASGGTWEERGDYEGSDIDPAGDTLNRYTSFSMNNVGYVYSIGRGNLFYGDVKVAITPLSFLSVSLGSLTLFRSVDGPVSALPVTEANASSSLFLGEEITLAVNIKPLSDLGFQVKGGVFIPNENVVDNGVQYKFGGYFSLSF